MHDETDFCAYLRHVVRSKLLESSLRFHDSSLRALASFLEQVALVGDQVDLALLLSNLGSPWLQFAL